MRHCGGLQQGAAGSAELAGAGGAAAAGALAGPQAVSSGQARPSAAAPGCALPRPPAPPSRLVRIVGCSDSFTGACHAPGLPAVVHTATRW